MKGSSASPLKRFMASVIPLFLVGNLGILHADPALPPSVAKPALESALGDLADQVSRIQSSFQELGRTIDALRPSDAAGRVELVPRIRETRERLSALSSEVPPDSRLTIRKAEQELEKLEFSLATNENGNETAGQVDRAEALLEALAEESRITISQGGISVTVGGGGVQIGGNPGHGGNSGSSITIGNGGVTIGGAPGHGGHSGPGNHHQPGHNPGNNDHFGAGDHYQPGYNPGNNGYSGPGGNHPGTHHPHPQPQPSNNQGAFDDGYRDGLRNGRSQGYMNGLRDGQIKGQNEGDYNGRVEGKNEGYAAGRRDGNKQGQEAGTLQGKTDGQSKGTAAGRRAGEKRCYDEGYAKGHDEGFAVGYKVGEQTDSFRKGQDQGVKDARVAEQEKGYQAGYKSGFSDKEKELRDSLPPEAPAGGEPAPSGPPAEYGSQFQEMVWINPNLTMMRNNYNPEEQSYYNQGYQRGYNESYNRKYQNAQRQGYNETYHQAFSSAYQNAFQNGYNQGFANGKDQGFKVAYKQAYDTAYNNHYAVNKNLEYSADRIRGYQEGLPMGKTDGYNAACKALYDAGYREGYNETTAVVYPQAYAEGRTAGTEAADKFYRENPVLEIKEVTVYDGDHDLIFKTGESFGTKVEIINYGFAPGSNLSLIATTTCKFITLQPQIALGSIPGRKKATLDSLIGAVNADAPMAVTAAVQLFLRNQGALLAGQTVKFELFNPAQKVGVINAGRVNVRKGPGTNYNILVTLDKGDKVAVVALEKSWYKVILGDGRTGYIYKPLLAEN